MFCVLLLKKKNFRKLLNIFVISYDQWIINKQKYGQKYRLEMGVLLGYKSHVVKCPRLSRVRHFQ